MLNKPASQLAEADLQLLITDSVGERRNIDYKRDLPGTTDSDKKEFLADVSSFANAIGGFLIFGMTEAGGFPTSICGTKATDTDREGQRIDNLLASGLQPRIRYEPAWIVTAQGPVLLIEIEKSLIFRESRRNAKRGLTFQLATRKRDDRCGAGDHESPA